MKKFKFALIALAAVFAFTSCETDDELTDDVVDEQTDDETTNSSTTYFSGDLSTTSPSGTSTSEDVTFIVTLNEDNSTASVTLQAVSFTTNMPAQTMVLPNISYSKSNGVISFSTDSVIPEIDEVPYESYVVTNLNAQINSGVLYIGFTCLSVYTVDYVGYADGAETPDTDTEISPDVDTETETDTNTETDTESDGTLTDSPIETSDASGILTIVSPTGTTNVSDKVFEAEINYASGTMQITMKEVSFITNMPELTMVIKDLSYVQNDGLFTVEADSAVPYVDDVAYVSNTMSNVKATIDLDQSTFTVSFTCMSVYNISYSGQLIY